jgi:hypothetical protein
MTLKESSASGRPQKEDHMPSHRLHVIEPLERRALLSNAIPVGPEFRVNTFTTGDQGGSRGPSIATDAQGNFVVAWAGVGEGDADGVFAQRFNAVGVPQGQEFRINTTTTGSQKDPTIAMADDGDFVVAWITGATGNLHVRCYDAAGDPLGEERLVASSASTASVAMDADGDFVVAWGRSGPRVNARLYDPTGTPRGLEFTVAHSAGRPSVAMDADGDFVIAFEREPEVWIYYFTDVCARRYDAQGVAQGNEFRVSSYQPTAESLGVPAVEMREDGSFLITWGWVFNIFYPISGPMQARWFDATGVPRGNQFDVDGAGWGDYGLALDAYGNFAVAWTRYRVAPGGTSVPDDIHVRRYDPSGAPRGEAFRVNGYTTGAQSSPAVAMGTEGDFVVAWTGQGAGEPQGVFAQRFAVVPEVTSSAFLFDSAPHRLRFNFDRDVRDSLAIDDLVLRKLTTNEIIPSNQFALLYDDEGDVATFMYLGQGSDAIGGVLPDGNYRATLRADGVVTPQGAPLAADHEFEFFFLNGDANRDGRVNLRDFNVLARHFGQTNTNFTQADFTYDGATDLEDFTLLAGRFGLSTVANSGPSSPGDRSDERDLHELLR